MFLHVPQKRCHNENRRTFPEPHLAYSLGFPVKEPSLQVLHTELPRRAMPPLLQPSFADILKSPVCEFLSRFPSVALYREIPVSRAFFYTSCRVSKYRSPPPTSPGSPHRVLLETDASPLEPLRLSVKVLVNEPPSRSSNGSAKVRDADACRS